MTATVTPQQKQGAKRSRPGTPKQQKQARQKQQARSVVGRTQKRARRSWRLGVLPLLGFEFACLTGWSFAAGYGVPGEVLWAVVAAAAGVPLFVLTARLVRVIRRVDSAQVALAHRKRRPAGGGR